MALISCSECGKSISDKAASCPGCGCPVEVFKFEEPQYVDCTQHNSEQLWQKAYDIQYKGKKSDLPTAVEIYNYILINHSSTLEAGYAKQQLEILKSQGNSCDWPIVKSLPETVECLECKKSVPFNDEICPHCGLFNSQKHALLEALKPVEPKPKYVKYENSVSEENTICKNCDTSYSYENWDCPQCHTLNPNYKSATVKINTTNTTNDNRKSYAMLTFNIVFFSVYVYAMISYLQPSITRQILYRRFGGQGMYIMLMPLIPLVISFIGITKETKSSRIWSAVMYASVVLVGILFL